MIETIFALLGVVVIPTAIVVLCVWLVSRLDPDVRRLERETKSWEEKYDKWLRAEGKRIIEIEEWKKDTKR